MHFWEKEVIFSYKNTQIQFSISDHVFFTAKKNKFFWKKNYISTMCKVIMKPSLHIEPVVLDFGTVPELMHEGFSGAFTEDTDRGIYIIIIIIIIINPLTARVVGAPQMILQPVFSISPCSPLPSGTCRTPGLSIPWCCLPTSSSVCLVFFALSLCLAIWFWPDLMNGNHDHTTAVCVSLRWSGGLRVVRLPAAGDNSALEGSTDQ